MDPQNSTPIVNVAPTQVSEPKSSLGPIVGAIIVIALLGFGAFYFWNMQSQKQDELLPFVPAMDDSFYAGEGTSAAPINDNSDLSSSDETAAIEADTAAAYMSQLEADLNADLEALENY